MKLATLVNANAEKRSKYVIFNAVINRDAT